MLIIDPNQRPDYIQLVIRLAIKNIGLSNQQQTHLTQVLNQSQKSQNSVILNGLVSVTLENENYVNNRFKRQMKKQMIHKILLISKSMKQKNRYSVFQYKSYQILNETFDYNDFTNVMNYATIYEGQVNNQKKHGPGTFFVNDQIEGKGQFYTINKNIVRGIWKAQILDEKLSVSRLKPLIQLQKQMNDKSNFRKQNQVDDVTEEIYDQKVIPMVDVSTLSHPQNEFNNYNKQYSSDQISYHSTLDINNRRQGYISNEQGIVIYAGLFHDDQYDGYGVLKNLNYEKIDLIDHMDLNIAINLKAWVKYDGEFKMGKKNGNGILHFSDKSLFQGSFQDDQIFGIGQFINSKKEFINGKLINGLYQYENQ